jgi:hypothetical protein
MLIQVIRRSFQALRIIFHITERQIATSAQKAASLSSQMTMINVESSSSWDFKANGATSILCDNHGVEFFYAQAIAVPAICASLFAPFTPALNDSLRFSVYQSFAC